MVKLTEVEDEHFTEKPKTTTDGALLADDDDEYTDTGMSRPPLDPYSHSHNPKTPNTRPTSILSILSPS